MRRVVCTAALAILVAGCDKGSSAPPPNTRQAVKGLPPAEAPQAGHPALPPGHPPTGGEAASAPPAGGDAVSGTLTVAPALKDQVKAGDTIYIVARAIDASGAVARTPVAVDRLVAGTFPMPFQLSAANAMVAGSPFAGPMQITARVDKDGEAMTREEGDVEGTVKVTVPQKDVQITLDTPVKP